MSYERTTKDSVGYIANKFAENPGHFAATILRMYWDMEKERDQYKGENKKLKEQIDTSQVSRLIAENEQLKENNEQLNEIFNYQENKKKQYFNEIVKLEKENKALRLQANTYFDKWQSVKNLYTTLTNHIRLKAEMNPSVSRYIDLVNYIDRLERD